MKTQASANATKTEWFLALDLTMGSPEPNHTGTPVGDPTSSCGSAADNYAFTFNQNEYCEIGGLERYLREEHIVPIGIKPNEADVLLGRGKSNQRHPGNARFNGAWRHRKRKAILEYRGIDFLITHLTPLSLIQL